MARHGSGRRNGLSGRTKKLDSELWQQDLDQQNGTRGSFRFPPDRRHQKRTTDVLRKPDNCKSYRQRRPRSAPIVFVVLADPVREPQIATYAGHVAWDMEPLAVPTEAQPKTLVV